MVAGRLIPVCSLHCYLLKFARLAQISEGALIRRNAIHLNSVPPLFSPPNGGDVRGGSLDSSSVAAFASLGSLWFPAVLLGRLAGHGHAKQSQPPSRDESSGLRKFLTVLSPPLFSHPRRGRCKRGSRRPRVYGISSKSLPNPFTRCLTCSRF